MRSKLFFSILVMVCGLFCSNIFALETATGIISEIGYGKFIIKDAKGTEVRYHEAKKQTQYSPENWRPNQGDKVKLTYISQQGRNGEVLRVTKLELIQEGSLTKCMAKSPVDVEIIEVGRAKILVNVIEAKQSIRFDKNRKTQYVPAGWNPNPGDKARVTFQTKVAKFTFGIVYLAAKIEKI